MKQLDWITEHYKIPCEDVTGLKIWNRPNSNQWDLYCDFLGMKGNIINFYVSNGDWYGELDVVNRTIYIEFTRDTIPYHKFEFIYEKPIDIK